MADVDVLIKGIASKKEEWHMLAVSEKIRLAEEMAAINDTLLEDWHRACFELRGDTQAGPYTPGWGESWFLGGGSTSNFLNTVIASLKHYHANGCFPAPLKVRTRDDGQKVVHVGPSGLAQSVMAGPGTKLELYLAQGQDVEQGKNYAKSKPAFCAVLGAGNFEAPTDIIHKMFMESHVVIYKANPVNELASHVAEKMFAPLIKRGYLAIVRGGVDVGSRIIEHPLVDELMMTGSHHTYNAIVWGAGAEGDANRKNKKRKVNKEFVAELGNCSPWLVVPGEYTAAELDHQAAVLVAAKSFNSGHICVSPQIIVTSKNWPQRQAFVERVEYHLSQLPIRKAYYPGAAKRFKEFQEQYPTAKALGAGTPKDEWLPTLFASGLSVKDSQFIRRTESFASMLSEVCLDVGADPAEYLRVAPDFCNNELWGTLACSVTVNDRTLAEHRKLVDNAIAQLKYGSIGINLWGVSGTMFACLPWGGFPGHTPEDIQSGVGYIGNCNDYSGVEKGVIWTPCVTPTHSVPAHLNKNGAFAMMRATYFVSYPSMWRLLKVLSGGLLGL